LGLGDQIGSLEVGKKADIILLDVQKPHLTPFHNLPGLLVYSALGSDVDTVIVDGRVLMQHRKFTTLNVTEILDKAQEAFKNILSKANWKYSLSEPTQNIAAALKLKATTQSLKIFQSMMENEKNGEEFTNFT
jgi:hypothetical protein